jgi:hypothetical protein
MDKRIISAHAAIANLADGATIGVLVRTPIPERQIQVAIKITF